MSKVKIVPVTLKGSLHNSIQYRVGDGEWEKVTHATIIKQIWPFYAMFDSMYFDENGKLVNNFQKAQYWNKHQAFRLMITRGKKLGDGYTSNIIGALPYETTIRYNNIHVNKVKMVINDSDVLIPNKNGKWSIGHFRRQDQRHTFATNGDKIAWVETKEDKRRVHIITPASKRFIAKNGGITNQDHENIIKKFHEVSNIDKF